MSKLYELISDLRLSDRLTKPSLILLFLRSFLAMTSSTSLFLFAAIAGFLLLPASALFPAASPASSSIPNPWLPFKNLSGCRHGEDRAGLAGLKDYLQHFGYLSPSNFTDAFDDALEAAVRTYQHNFGLNVTGELDSETISQIITPRCGVGDFINGSSTMNGSSVHGRNLYSYFPGTPRWPIWRRSLTYAIVSTSDVSIDRAVFSGVLARAFERWANATTLTFTETESEAEADLQIGFFLGSHGDGEPFDGQLGTLAHAFSPTDGRLHFDAAEAWVAQGDVSRADSDSAVDLESVAVHEIGHLLGLGHSTVAEAIMYPSLRTRTRKVELANDDVEGIQNLYGSNPDYQGSSQSTPGSESVPESSGGGGASPAGRGWGWWWPIWTLAAISLWLE
ncbi:metalloendoproteinase 5-MMP-like [Curcuma longa]|uniref:metalloendoproteinase 5-MMP-like n=1 Tax=Curcuma longa TaxID=136217 RepID=UPI003D9DCA25